MKIRKLLLLSLFTLPLFAKPICYFNPPAGWELVQPKQYKEYVHIAFVGKNATQFPTLINLATEEVNVSLKNYVKSVKQAHTEGGASWRDLGKFSMKAGVGRLTEITENSPWGEHKKLQALFIKENTAYILTAAALKDDMPKCRKDLLQALQSLQLAEDLLEGKPELKGLFAKLGSSDETEQNTQWENLQKAVIENHPEMGSHWHFLVLKDGYAKIHSQLP